MFQSLLLSLILFLSSVTAPAASKVDGALPGELLYRIDRILEDMQLKNARTPEERARLHLIFTQERLQETQALLELGDAVNLETALDGLSISLEELEKEALDADPDRKDGVIGIVDEVFDGPQYYPDAVNRGFYCSNLETYYHPVGYKIAQLYEVDYEDEVMSWYCAGYGLGEVKLAFQISEKTEYPVESLFAMRNSGQGWGKIMHMPGELDDPEKFDDDPSVTEELLETQELEGNTKSGEEDPDEDERTSGEEVGICTGADPHPTGESLALEYNVGYDVIMAYFCRGYGFGEIRLAYNIAYTVGVDVDVVFDQRAGGMGWGQIMQDYEVSGNPKNPGNGGEDKGERPVTPDPGAGGKPDHTPSGKPDKATGKPDKGDKTNK
jgi:hypothetical protein